MNGMRTLAALAVLTILLVATSARAQDTDRAAVALQRAIRIELVDGDLQTAIALYEEIATRFSADRGVVATALQHLGQCYEKLGAPEARATYERVLREYADQAEPVAAVRARIAALQADPIKVAELDAMGDVSADGRLLTYVDWSTGDLALRDLHTGEDRRLTHESVCLN